MRFLSRAGTEWVAEIMQHGYIPGRQSPESLHWLDHMLCRTHAWKTTGMSLSSDMKWCKLLPLQGEYTVSILS